MTATAWTMPTRAEAEAAARRLGPPDVLLADILDIAAARALALDTLLRLSAIEWSAEVSTACVECADRPRLLMNAAFVERWCTTREKLAALLMHELAHVSMGHTRIFPRAGHVQNIACDAVINRELLATIADARGDVPRFAALFEEFYSADTSPAFLLRPPPGWPQAPDWSASSGCPERLREIHRRLYAVQGDIARASERYKGIALQRHTVLYAEIVDALRAAGINNEDVLIVLLGGHDATPLEQAIVNGGRDDAAADTLAPAMLVLSGKLAGAGGDPFAHQVGRAARRAALERALAALLRRVFTTRGDRRHATVSVERPIRCVDPRCDRRAPARMALARAFGAPRPLLFDGTMVARRPAPRDALVYLDVSGSMFGTLPALHASLVPLRRLMRPQLHLFSTEVVPVDATAFDAGRLSTTGGTSIAPVFTHAIAEARASGAQSDSGYPVLVITDGWFMTPPPELSRAARDAGVRVHLGIAGDGPTHERAEWVTSSTRLPSL